MSCTILGHHISLIRERAHYASKCIRGTWKKQVDTRPRTKCQQCGKVFVTDTASPYCPTCEMTSAFINVLDSWRKEVK